MPKRKKGSAGRVVLAGAVSASYDLSWSAATGQLTGIAGPGGQSLAYGYDGFLPTSATWSGPVAGTVSRAYDHFLRPSSLTVGSQSAAFGYDDDGLLTSAGALGLTRHASHGLVSATSLGSLTTAATYNGFGEPSSDAASYGGTPLYSNVYTRDKLGRIIQKSETIQGTTTLYNYTYDLAGRLYRVRENSVLVRQYTYDANGNRLRYDPGHASDIASYDLHDRLLAYDDLTFSYDDAGDRLSKTDTSTGDVTTTVNDALGNLTKVTLPNGDVIEYVIDGQNRRVGRKVNGSLQQGFLYQDQLNPVAELDGSGSLVSFFVYGSRGHVPDYMVKGGNTYRILSDQVGSVRLVVNTSTGTVAQRIDYDEFGNVTADTNPGFQPFGFAGGIYDRDTGLTRFGARDYDAEVGRWTTKDPIRFDGGLNHYAYVSNDPVNWIDPTGREKMPPQGRPCGSTLWDPALPPGPPIGSGDPFDLWNAYENSCRQTDAAEAGSLPADDPGETNWADIDEEATPPYAWYIPSGDPVVDFSRCVHETRHLIDAGAEGPGVEDRQAAEQRAYEEQARYVWKHLRP